MLRAGYLLISLNRDEINDRPNRSTVRALSRWRGLDRFKGYRLAMCEGEQWAHLRIIRKR
jgi:hypothetical protein